MEKRKERNSHAASTYCRIPSGPQRRKEDHTARSDQPREEEREGVRPPGKVVGRLSVSGPSSPRAVGDEGHTGQPEAPPEEAGFGAGGDRQRDLRLYQALSLQQETGVLRVAGRPGGQGKPQGRPLRRVLQEVVARNGPWDERESGSRLPLHAQQSPLALLPGPPLLRVQPGADEEVPLFSEEQTLCGREGALGQADQQHLHPATRYHEGRVAGVWLERTILSLCRAQTAQGQPDENLPFQLRGVEGSHELHPELVPSVL